MVAMVRWLWYNTLGGDGMNELFIGMLLVFLDVNVSITGHTFEILPDFLGYFLMMRGLEALSAESHWFEKARPAAMGMAVYSALVYAVDVLAVTVYSRFLSFCLSALATVVSLLIGWWIVSGVQDVERRRGWDLEGEKLRGMWLYAAVIQGITCVCAWIPLVGQMGLIATLVMYICYLAAFYRTKNLYESKQ